MNNKEKEEYMIAAKAIFNNMLVTKILCLFWCLSILGMTSSIFVFIWDNWDLAWKIFASSLMIWLFCGTVMAYLSKVFMEHVERNLVDFKPPTEPETKKSRFQIRLDEALKKGKIS